MNAVFVESAQVLGNLPAIHLVKSRGEPLFNDADGFGDVVDLTQHITTRHGTTRRCNGTDGALIQQRNQLVLVNRVHAGFHIDTLISVGCTGVVGAEHGVVLTV
ncbi:hypothetical protein D3C72_1806450 [compost metagenome]